MALQDIINSAVNIEVNRSKLIAQTISRNGRISVASRNWNNPFRFTVTPKPVWSYDDYREQFEPLFNNDRFNSQIFALTNFNVSTGASLSPGSDWLTEYQGQLADATDQILDNYTATSISGNSLTITKAGSPTVGQYIVRAGDYIRMSGGNYPYIVTTDLQVSASATETITLHRGAIESVAASTPIFVGRRAALFKVIVSKLPQIRFLPGKLVEFTDNFELFEDIQ
jgi:hypothetical protein